MSKITNPTTEASVTCGFFNSVGDRKYDATQMSSIFDGVISDGIFATVEGCFVVNADSGNVVKVSTGKAWFNHTWTKNDAILPVECADSDILLNRIDAIVIEVNSSDSVRDNFIKFISGTPATEPVAPTMVNTELIHQYPLCYIYRAAGSTEITQAEITNCVGTDSTPFVTGLLDVVSLDQLLGQWRSELDQFISKEELEILTWFENIKQHVSTDAIVNLQAQIDDINQNGLMFKGNISTFSTSLTNGLYYVNSTDGTFPYQYGILEVSRLPYSQEAVYRYHTTGIDLKTYHRNTSASGEDTGWKQMVCMSDICSKGELTGIQVSDGTGYIAKVGNIVQIILSIPSHRSYSPTPYKLCDLPFKPAYNQSYKITTSGYSSSTFVSPLTVSFQFNTDGGLYLTSSVTSITAIYINTTYICE